MTLTNETLDRLEKELAVHKRMVEILQNSIKEIHSAQKSLGTGASGLKRRGRPPGSKNKKNDFPLPDVLVKILTKTKGMSLTDIVPKVIEQGYKSSSKDLTKNIYAALGNLIKAKKITKDVHKNYKAA